MLISEKPGLWARQWEREGLRKGRQEGMLAGQASLLERQLVRKFGALPAETAERIRQADAAQLETWSLNILDASSLDEVFDH